MAAAAAAEEDNNRRLRLEDYIVGSVPTLVYIPNFISETEQSQLLHHIYEAPASRWKCLKNRRLQNWGGVVHEKGLLPQNLPPWLTKVTQRICQQTGLFPSAINHVLINEYLPDQGIMPHQDGPAYFPVVAILSLESPVVIDFTPHQRLKECTNKERNTIDDSTCRTETEVDYMSNNLICKPNDTEHPCSLLLMPRSLLIFKDQAYSEYLHGIQDSEVQRLDKVVNISDCLKLKDPKSSYSSGGALEHNCTGDSYRILRTKTRVSLTCRLVLKVHKNLFKF